MMHGPAKTLDPHAEALVLAYIVANRPRTARRDRVAVLLSWRAGLRVCEIARLCWADVTDASGTLADTIRIRRETTKGKTFTRFVPMHGDLKAALLRLAGNTMVDPRRPLLLGRSKQAFSVNALTVFFHRLYADTGLDGCSSHSGRRTFITRTARRCTDVGASIEDVRLMAGHAYLSTTAGYIDPNQDAKHKLVALI
ncbi:MAG: site-specific integrase [Pseudomonadota bacterium]